MNNENLKPIEKLTPFTKMIMTIGTLPSSFYSSMTYYEAMCWLYEYLKNEVIPTVNNNAEAVEELQTAFTTLETFINEYFDNLDVQEEINKKLDEMAEDGSLTNLIKAYVDPIQDAFEDEMQRQYDGFESTVSNRMLEQDVTINTFKGTINQQVNAIQSQVESATSGSPKGVYSTVSDLETDNPDHDYIYVVLADGKWYYYDTSTTSWTAGGTYQSTEIGENSIFVQNFESNIQNRIKDYIDYRELGFTDIPGHFINSSGNQGSTGNLMYVMLTVKENDIIKIDDYALLSANAPTYVLLNGTTVVDVGDTMSSLEDAHYQEEITIPTSVNKIAINFDVTKRHYIGIKNIIDCKNLENNINSINGILQIKESITPTTNGTGYIGANISTGVITINSGYTAYKYKKYNVSTIEKAFLKLQPKTNATIYGVIFTNVSDVIVSVDYYESNMNETINDIIYTPTDAKYLYIQTDAEYDLDLYNYTYLSQDSIKNEDLTYDRYAIKQLERRCTNLENQNEFEWGTFDKTYFVFVEDDTNNYFPKAVEIFADNNVPLSSAAIIENLNRVWTDYTPDNTKTVKELLDDIVENGGEVLSHYSGNLAPPGTPDTQTIHYLTSEADWLSKTRDVKMTLENNGFNVRGIILADSSKANTSTGQKYCSLYFDYSDRMGTSKNFNLGRRKFFSDNELQTLQGFKDYIDECCQTPGFYPFCFHKESVNEPMASEENLNAILSYINAKGSSVCECTTYSYVFDNFGSTELNERIKALES